MPALEGRDEEEQAAVQLSESPAKTAKEAKDFSAAIELREHLTDKACVAHDERSTIHILAKNGMTACRRNPADQASKRRSNTSL